MDTLERIVKDVLVDTLCSKSAILEIFPIEGAAADKLQTITSAASALGEETKVADQLILKALYNDVIDTITLQTDQICITFNAKALSQKLGITLNSDVPICLTKLTTIRRRGQEMKMVIGEQELQAANTDPVLIKLVAKAHLLKSELESGAVTSIKDFATQHNMDHGDAKNLMPLSYLAPSIIEDILAGRHPVDMTARRLKYLSDLPIIWPDQRTFLGFN